jgi:hypothetical protein
MPINKDIKESILFAEIPNPVAYAIIALVVIILFLPPALKARKAAKQSVAAEERYKEGLKKASAIVDKFNKETGHEVRTIREVTDLMKKEGWFLNKASNSWKRLK